MRAAAVRCAAIIAACVAFLILSPSKVEAQSIRVGGGNGGDAALLDGLDSTAFITTSLTTNTTAVTMNATGNDVQSASGSALRVYAAGVANLEIGSGNNRVDYVDSGGTVRLMTLFESAERLMFSAANNLNGRFGIITDGSFSGAAGDKSAITAVHTIADGVGSDFSMTALLRVFGGGHVAPVGQAAVCAAGVLALDPSSDRVYLDSAAANCVLTLSETNAVIGSEVIIAVVTASGAAGVTIPDVANVVVSNTVCDTTGLQIDGRAKCTYVDAADDHYVCKCEL